MAAKPVAPAAFGTPSMPGPKEDEPDKDSQRRSSVGLGLLVSGWAFVLSVSLIALSLLLSTIEVFDLGPALLSWERFLIVAAGVSWAVFTALSLHQRRQMPSPGPRKPVQYSLRALMAVVTLAALALSLERWLGLHGPLLLIDGVVVATFTANLCEETRLFGITVPRMTFLQFVAWIAVCITLHGLAR